MQFYECLTPRQFVAGYRQLMLCFPEKIDVTNIMIGLKVFVTCKVWTIYF